MAGAFGSVLAARRQAKGLSQAELASRAKVSHSHVSRLESGARAPTREMVLLLAAALGGTGDETAALLLAAGYVSIHDPALRQLVGLLADEKVPAVIRASVRCMVADVVTIARAKAAQALDQREDRL